MKASELMIGDYLRCKETGRCLRVMQLTGIVGDNIMLEDGDESDVSTFEPIPLTEEILKANGFQYGSHEYTYWPDEDGEEAPFHILQSNRYGLRIDIPYRVVTLQYVHQLQHALRLCGLNDLADNLKVE